MLRAGAARGFKALVRRLGGEPEALLRRQGLSPDALEDEDALVPARALAQLLESAAAALDCPDFGLRLAGNQDLTVLGPLAVAIQHSATVADSLDCTSRYLFVHNPAIALSVLSPAPGRRRLAELRYEITEAGWHWWPQSVDLTLGFVHRTLSLLGREHYRLGGVHLPHAPLAQPARYTAYFGAPVAFSQPHAALLVPQAVLDTRLEQANETLSQMAASYLEANFPATDETVSARVRLALSRSLGMHPARKAHIADMLAMHPRTLQRHLAEEGTTFEAIREAVCRQKALQFLTATRLPLSQVAALLGFSEQSVLTRSCRRWFGSTPSAIRRSWRDGLRPRA